MIVFEVENLRGLARIAKPVIEAQPAAGSVG